MKVNFKWGRSADRFNSTVRRNAIEMNTKVSKVVDRTGDDILVDARNNTPVDSGRLRNGWRIKRAGKKTKNQRSNTVSNAVPYALAVEYGTSKTKPRRMLGKSLAKNEKRMKKRLNAVQKKLARKFNRSS